MSKPIYRVAEITEPNSIGAFYDSPHMALYIANGRIDAYGLLTTTDGFWLLPELTTAFPLWEAPSVNNCCWLFQNPPYLPLVLCLVDFDTYDTNEFYYSQFLNTANRPVAEERGFNAPVVVHWTELQAGQLNQWLMEAGYGR